MAKNNKYNIEFHGNQPEDLNIGDNQDVTITTYTYSSTSSRVSRADAARIAAEAQAMAAQARQQAEQLRTQAANAEDGETWQEQGMTIRTVGPNARITVNGKRVR